MHSFKSLKKPPLSQEVERQLRESIIEGVFKPGEKLPSERELVEQFQVSRVTVREALKNLERSGLIESRRGGNAGAYVCELNADAITENFLNLVRLGRATFNDLIEARIFIEPNTARAAALKRTSKNIADLKQLLDTATELTETSCRQARLLNVSFHCEISKISQNPIVIFITESITHAYSEILIEKTSRTVGKEDVLELVRQHQEILKAIIDMDGAAAHEKTRLHLENTRRMYQRVVDKTPA
jgi:DNA-binding FadR family transcriptional regulator